MIRLTRERMDPMIEDFHGFNAHVVCWKTWYQRVGRHYDNGLRHPDYQLDNPPSNAQNKGRNEPVSVGFMSLFAQLVALKLERRWRGW
ncbi:hypothetical protein D9M68_563010 [compost metagenome]